MPRPQKAAKRSLSVMVSQDVHDHAIHTAWMNRRRCEEIITVHKRFLSDIAESVIAAHKRNDKLIAKWKREDARYSPAPQPRTKHP